MFIVIVRPIGKVKKLFSGSLTISSQTFSDAYENSNSTEYKELASKVSKQVRWSCFFERFFFSCFYLSTSSMAISRKWYIQFIILKICIILPCLSAQNNIRSSALAVQVLCRIQCARFQVIK